MEKKSLDSSHSPIKNSLKSIFMTNHIDPLPTHTQLIGASQNYVKQYQCACIQMEITTLAMGLSVLIIIRLICLLTNA